MRAILLAVLGCACAVASAAPVVLVPLEGAIGPASAHFARRGIERAAKEGAELVILQIDTPGGLDTSMREVIKAILASPVPVVVFVAPSGARAASAGTFILYAAHIAAMAPGTNLGAASPVSIGGGGPQKDGKKEEDTMTRKVTNDAVAYIRGLAELRGRNANWAEKAVREGVSLPAQDALTLKVVEHIALKLKVIDHIAADVPSLLAKLGKANAEVKVLDMDWRTRVLAVITNPTVAYLLVLVGIYALIFEFMNPGLILPGVVGAIALLLALYALHLLPVNYACLALMLLGIAFMIAELFLPTFGAIGVGGIVAFVLGSLLLIEDTELPGFEIPYGLIGGAAAASAGFLIVMAGMLLKSRRRAVVTGREEMLGATGEALGELGAGGWARVHGEQWKVRSSRPVRRGQKLRVTAMEGLVLNVEPAGPGDKLS